MTTLNRRQFLAAGSAVPVAGKRSVNAAKPPNLMIMIGDDHTYFDIGCCGSDRVRTPNIDRLAREGMRFTRAFAGTAMCAPMRQQLLTGIFPVRNGAYPNHSQVKPGIRTWPSYFAERGYRVALLGKRHFGPPAAFPFEYLDDGNADTLNFTALEQFIRRRPADPYCVFVTSHQPHLPHTQGDPARHPPASLKIPPYWVDTPATRDVLSQYYAEVEYLDSEIGQCLDILERSGTAENTIAMYCSEQGNAMPFAKWTCYDNGLRETAIVRWPGLVKPASVSHAMVQTVDWLPTMLEAAGGRAPEGIDGRSFLPVLLGRAASHADLVYGVHTTRGIIGGADCYPIRSIRTGRHKLILNLNHSAKFQCVIMSRKESYWQSWLDAAVKDQRAKKIVERFTMRPAVELYDIANDPFEQHNLASRPEHARLIESLRTRLHRWMNQQGDRGIETEMLVRPSRRGAATEG